MGNSIDINEIRNIVVENNLIDIRDKYEFNLERIPRAINVPYQYLLMNHESYLTKNMIYYLYCDNGINSKKLGMELSELGYKIVNLDGGYKNYLN